MTSQPKFISSWSPYPKCNQENRSQTTKIRRSDRSYVEPCHQIEKVFYSYNEYEIPILEDETEEDLFFELKFNFQGRTYMEIAQMRDYDLQSLIGNAGGYFGLFLGVCLLQLPQALLNAYNFAKGIPINS